MTGTTQFLLLGEYDVGKTHYGAQLLRRLNRQTCALRMDGAAQNIEPFQAALERISQGLSAEHTPNTVYADSVWPVADADGVNGDLVWPDYGGEQIATLIDSKKLPTHWRDRALQSEGWIIMIRPTRTILPEDALTRTPEMDSVSEDDTLAPMEGQARIIELLQMLIHTFGNHRTPPPLAVLLSCYDEVSDEMCPPKYLGTHLPLVSSFLRSNWYPDRYAVFGLSALGGPLSKSEPDHKFATNGPQNHGYVIGKTGDKSDDLTTPIVWLLSAAK